MRDCFTLQRATGLLRWPGASTHLTGAPMGTKVGAAEVAVINQRAGHKGQASLSHPHSTPLPLHLPGKRVQASSPPSPLPPPGSLP